MNTFLEDRGKGEPVVLAHAGVTDSRIWDLAVPLLLDAGYRVIRYDLPGYGRSEAPTKPYSLVELALRLLDESGLEAVHWVGLSQGGATGVDLTLAHPERIKTLALVAPGLSGYDWPKSVNREAMEAAYLRGDAHGLAVEVLRRWGPMSFASTGEVLDEPAAKIVLEQAGWFMAEDDFEIEEPSAVDRLGEIRVPTLIVLGEQDEATITDIGRIYAEGIPGAQSVTLAGADHLLPLRVPEQLHPLLLEHLGRSAGSAPVLPR
ncbi:MAG TPA: alpha/beta hydrolase [Micromonosporaceae bacterium]|nr:alpha/beta hydrolase [Micromonosporaceae bacterium]HCU48603.1 alpha/beta hydrolase [Micromonosporaceae bacterium]